MHTGVSGCGHFLVEQRRGGDRPRQALPRPTSPARATRSPRPRRPRAAGRATPIRELIPADENKPWNMHELIDAVVDEDSFLEVHKRWAKEVHRRLARLDGRVVGIVANQPKFKGGVLFVDSADKAARFIWTCNAFGIPLLFLADVPGFMIGTQVERQGIIRHGAKMISAVSRGDRAEAVGDRAQGVRRGPVRDGRPGLRPRRDARAAERQDRGDGPERGRQRRLLQPAAGDRGRGRAGGAPDRADGGVRRAASTCSSSRPRW